MRALSSPRITSLLILGIGCALLAAVAAPTRAGDPDKTESKVTKENADKIKTGMTVKEVEAILGTGKDLPAADFPTPRTRVQARLKQILEGGGKGLKWENGKKLIIVIFKDGKVVGTSFRNL